MANFKIYQDKEKDNNKENNKDKDKENNKENASASIPVKAKNAKQPLGSLNSNKINKKKNCKSTDKEVNLHKPLVKKSNELLPVIKKLRAISLPEDKVPCSPMSIDRSVTEVLSSNTEKKYKKVIKTPATTRSSANTKSLATCRFSAIARSSSTARTSATTKSLATCRSSAITRSSASTKSSATSRTLAPTRFPATTRNSTTSKSPATARSSTPSKSSAPTRSSATFKSSATTRSSGTTRSLVISRSLAYEEVHYQMDILANCRESELKNRPNPLYMHRQNDLCDRMRAILVDWLVEVGVDYQMNTETIYLSVSYIDRFLSKVAVKRTALQLVGTTALFIASKFEEMSQPQIDELIYITEDSYTREEILYMERLMLKMLSFNLMTPTPYAFIKMYAVMCDDMSGILKSLTMYICELSLLKADPFLHFLPSMISSAALALARHILGREMWSPHLEKITTYKLKDLKDVILALSNSHKSASELKLQGIRNKYKGRKFGNVAVIDDIPLTQDLFVQLCQVYENKHSKKI